MINFILFFFLAVSAFYSQPIQKIDYFSRQKFTPENFELDKIKELKIQNRKRYSAYYIKNQKLPEKKTLVEEIKFKNGMPAEKIFYNSFGGIRTRIIYSYDKKNNLVSEETQNEYGNIISRRETKYNKLNDTSEVALTFTKQNKNEKKIFLYDADNKLTAIKHFNHEDKNYLNKNFVYESGKLKFLQIINGDGIKIDEIEFLYNEFGNLSIEKQKGVEKKYIYNDKNLLTKVESGNELRVYNYNNRNYLEDDRFFLNNKRQFRLTFSYLENGLMDEVIRYDSEDIKVFYSKYEYK